MKWRRVILARREFAHYYGDWIWEEELTDWVKSLLLFFDGIALGLPEKRAERLIESDSVLAQPLAELGLLHNYWPDAWAKRSNIELPEGLREFFRRMEEIFKRVPIGGTLSEADLRSLDAAVTDPELRDVTKNYGIRVSRAKQTFGDAPSQQRALTIASVSMFLVENINEVAIQPVIDDEDAAAFVAAIIGSHDNGRAKVMTGDLRHVGIDLQAVPLDEVLDFRRQHGSEYRAYSQEVRQFVLELSLLSEVDQASAFEERRAELDERAEELRRVARSAFKRQSVGLGFGLAGAAWTIVHGDAWGGLFVAGAAAAGLSALTPGPIGAAYTYVLQAKAELTR